MIIYILIGLIVAYLIGSIPTAVWYGKKFHNIDVREHGNGNSGATNTFRVLGKKPGSIVMAFDSTKGYLGTMIPVVLYQINVLDTEYLTSYQIGFGILAVVGHIFPVFARFKGGKGVASLLGMAFALHPSAAFTCVVVFTVILLSTHYVSLGSILSGLVFLLLQFTPLYTTHDQVLKGFGLAVFILLIYTHRQNIERLIKGTENKIFLIKKDK